MGTFGLIILSTKGHWLRVQRAEGHRLGTKRRGEWSWSHGVVSFLMGCERLKVRLREPNRKKEWRRQTSWAKAGTTDEGGVVLCGSGALESGRGLKALLFLSLEGQLASFTDYPSSVPQF